jgi:hypothetical protein
MPDAGYVSKVFAKASNAAHVPGDEILFVKSVSRSETMDSEDATYLGGSGVKDRVLTLRDFNLSIDGHFEPGDPVHALLKSSFDGRTPVYITVIRDSGAAPGSQGYKYKVKLESFDEDTAAEGVVTFSLSASAAGEAPVAV